MKVDANHACSRPWIADCPSTTSPEPNVLRRHEWEEYEDKEGYGWRCSVCEIEVDAAYFKQLNWVEVPTLTGLDVFVHLFTTHYPRSTTTEIVKRCPRFT